MSFTQILTALLALSVFEDTPNPQNSTYREQCDAGVVWYMEKNFSPKTSLVYTCPPDECQKSDGCTNGMFHWYQGCPDGYGKGISDCALIDGTVLAKTLRLNSKARSEVSRTASGRHIPPSAIPQEASSSSVSRMYLSTQW